MTLLLITGTHNSQDSKLWSRKELFFSTYVYILVPFLMLYSFLKYISHIFLFFPSKCRTTFIELVASQTSWPASSTSILNPNITNFLNLWSLQDQLAHALNFGIILRFLSLTPNSIYFISLMSLASISRISSQLSLPNNHNYLFDNLPALLLNLSYLIIFLNTIWPCSSEKPLLSPQQTHSLPLSLSLSPPFLPSSLSSFLSNWSVRFSKASKVWCWPNVYPPWLLTTHPHRDYGLTAPIYSTCKFILNPSIGAFA